MSERKMNTNREGKTWTDTQKKHVWNKTKEVSIDTSVPDDDIIQDMCGAKIKYSEHGKKTPKAWHIDHIKPVSKKGSDNLSNLQALQWENNLWKGNKECSDFEYESCVL